MAYEVLLSPEAEALLNALATKSERIIRDNLDTLADNPHPRPGSGSGDREKIIFDGIDEYRPHIGRTWTAFDMIEEDSNQVRIHEITDIDDAHKRYG